MRMPVRMKKRIGAFAVAFATVTIGGAAVAAVGGAPAAHVPPGAALDFAAEASQGDSASTTVEGARSRGFTPRKSEPEPRRGVTPAKPTPASILATNERLNHVAPDPGDDTPPRIAILEPAQGAEFRTPHITVYGETEPGAKVVLGDFVARMDDGGHWKIEVELEPGENALVFHAIDQAGNVGKANLTVYYLPEREHVFTANQRWKVVDEDPAVNIYWGTAKPGAEIKIRSEYGHGVAEANRDGKWETRVEFAGMPCNEYFRVVAQTGDKLIDFKMKKACAVDVEFTAHQKYGECSEAIPYDVFYGKAAPGTEIWVESPYGGGSTVAGAEGYWELKVEFAEAPVGKVFEVVVESSNGDRKVFTFVNAGAEH